MWAGMSVCAGQQARAPSSAPTLIESLSHLGSQGIKQQVIGPLQDDEALFLFALVRTSHVSRVLEIGGLLGDSARNFLRALRSKEGGKMFTIDVNRVRRQDRPDRHIVIRKDANDFEAADIGHQPIDLLFLDCHNYQASVALVRRTLAGGLLSPSGYIVLHDTGLHARKVLRSSLPWLDRNASTSGSRLHWIHQPVERQLATWIERQYGWQRISFHDDDRKPFRHGLTVMQRAVNLGVPASAHVENHTHYFGAALSDPAKTRGRVTAHNYADPG